MPIFAENYHNMEITFQKEGNLYVAVVEVNADYNLHIECEEPSSFVVYQRTAGTRFATKHSVVGVDIIDDDFDGIVYPKTIKITSTKPAVVAEIIEA